MIQTGDKTWDKPVDERRQLENQLKGIDRDMEQLKTRRRFVVEAIEELPPVPAAD